MIWDRLLLCAIVTLAPLGALAGSDQAPLPDGPMSAPAVIAVSPDYLIGKEDVLNVHVWKEPELSRLVAVRSDGKISLPLVGDLKVEGLTTIQLTAVLTKELNGYMTAPVVTVSVQEARSQRFTILGEVSRPGNYPLATPMTVLDALAVAGGFRDFAKTNAIFILRNEPNGKQKRIPLRYKRMITAARPNDNLELQSRDTIIIP